MIKPSELILNADGSVYHLNLLPEDIADLIITVGDPQRVAAVSKHFDDIIVNKSNREFVTHTGLLDGKKITVISTGIGTDNIDIVFNELDALANINLKKRTINGTLRQLTFIRIGTSGCLRKEIPLDSILFSSAAIGIDSLMSFYDVESDNRSLSFKKEFDLFLKTKGIDVPYSYYNQASEKLLQHFKGKETFEGVTISCPGFYAPQGRSLRLKSNMEPFLREMVNFEHDQKKVCNFEMETAGIYALAYQLGHRAISCNVLLANRAEKTFSQTPQQSVSQLIEYCIEKIRLIDF